MKWIKRLCSFIFLCLFLVVAFMLWRGYGDCQDALKKMSVQQMGAQIQAKEDYTTLDQLPKDYIDAVLAVEDKRFYKHPGIDPLAICRALYNDIRAGSYVEGGSTITQQLAKNQFFTQDKKISRKVAEMFMAFEIEKVYDKDTILELYLNSIYFGNGLNHFLLNIASASVCWFIFRSSICRLSILDFTLARSSLSTRSDI